MASAPVNPPEFQEPPRLHSAAIRAALRALDAVDLSECLSRKVLVLQSPPPFAKGQLRLALGLALEAIEDAGHDAVALSRAWALWLLVPRMLLFRLPGQRVLRKPEWRDRVSALNAGRWAHLLAQANLAGATVSASEAAPPAASPPSADRRAERATSLVRLGELSTTSSALVAGPLAPLSEATLAELRDPERRPSEPYGDIDSAPLQFQPESPVRLPPGLLLANLRRARKGAGAGPSGLTAECCRVVLDDKRPRPHGCPSEAQPPLVWLLDCCRHAGLCCQLVCLAFRWLVLPGRPCARFQ